MPSNPAGSSAVRYMLDAVNAERPDDRRITASQYVSARSAPVRFSGDQVRRVEFVPLISGDEPPSRAVINHCAAVLPTRKWWSKRGARDPRLMLLFHAVTDRQLLPEYMGATPTGAGMLQEHLVSYIDDQIVSRSVQLGTDAEKFKWAQDEAQASVERYRKDPRSKAVQVLATLIRRRLVIERQNNSDRPQMSAEEEIRDFLEVQNYRRLSHSWVAYNGFEVDATGSPLDSDAAVLLYGEAEQWAVAAPLHTLMDSFLNHDGSPEGTRPSHEAYEPEKWDQKRRFARLTEVGGRVRDTQPMLREIRDALTFLPIPTAVLRLTAVLSARLITHDPVTGEPRLEAQQDKSLFENFLTAYAMFACMKLEPGA